MDPAGSRGAALRAYQDAAKLANECCVEDLALLPDGAQAPCTLDDLPCVTGAFSYSVRSGDCHSNHHLGRAFTDDIGIGAGDIFSCSRSACEITDSNLIMKYSDVFYRVHSCNLFPFFDCSASHHWPNSKTQVSWARFQPSACLI